MNNLQKLQKRIKEGKSQTIYYNHWIQQFKNSNYKKKKYQFHQIHSLQTKHKFSLSLSLLTHTHTRSASQIPIFIIIHSISHSFHLLVISLISYIFFIDVGSIAQENPHNIFFSSGEGGVVESLLRNVSILPANMIH